MGPVVPIVQFYLGICLRGTRKAAKKLRVEISEYEVAELHAGPVGCWMTLFKQSLSLVAAL